MQGHPVLVGEGGQVRHVAAAIGAAKARVLSFDNKDVPKLRHCATTSAGRHSEGGRITGHIAGDIANGHGELRAIVRGGGGRSGVARCRGPRYGRAVFPPSVAQGRGACRYHREGGRLTHRHCLAGRLRGDGRRRRSAVHRECGGIAGHAACRVAHHHDELGAVVCGGRRGRGVAGRSRPADSGCVLLPLVTQRCRARGYHGERGHLPHSHRLVRRLRGDQGCYRSRIDRKRGGVACHAPRGVADHHNELRAVIGRSRRGGSVASRSRPADGRAILLPLVTQRCCACGHHRERGGLSHRHCLVHWLRGDRGCCCRRIDHKRDRVACDAPRRVANHHLKLGSVI